MTQTEQNPPLNRSTLARPWVIRMVPIFVVLVAFGGWGFYDASVKYPQRGRLHAEALEFEYLQAAQKSGRLFEAGIFDPKAELATLEGLDVLELSEFDRAKRDWLRSLNVPGLGLLNADYTRLKDPEAELTRLATYFQSHSAPPELGSYDILSQWLICVVCWALAAVVLVLFLVVSSRKYAWDAATKTLTLPGGSELKPDDLDPSDPADLARWHKFIIFLRPKPGHANFGGPLKLDLFRHHPLEDWVRELVKGADPDFEFPDEAKRRAEAEAEAAAAAESAGEGEASEQDPES